MKRSIWKFVVGAIGSLILSRGRKISVSIKLGSKNRSARKRVKLAAKRKGKAHGPSKNSRKA